MKFMMLVVAADSLSKREVFRLPDPFAVITADGEQTRSTSVIKKTLNPYWNEAFILRVSNDSIITIQIFDQKKWKKEESQGFLGLVNISIADIFDINADGGDEILTLDLKKGNSNTYVSGKIVVGITTRGIGADGTEAASSNPTPLEFLSVNERPSSRNSTDRANAEILSSKPATFRSESSSQVGSSGTNPRRNSNSSAPSEEPLPQGYKIVYIYKLDGNKVQTIEVENIMLITIQELRLGIVLEQIISKILNSLENSICIDTCLMKLNQVFLPHL